MIVVTFVSKEKINILESIFRWVLISSLMKEKKYLYYSQ